jgi:hypothetical protein
MTDDDRISLTRRKALGVLSTVGAAATGAGFGTAAYLSDPEPFEQNTVQAGDLNLKVHFEGGATDANGETMATDIKTEVTVDGNLRGAYVVEGLEPEDSGWLRLIPSIEGEPAYVFAGGTLQANDENSVTELEAASDKENDDPAPDADIDGRGELAQNVAVGTVDGFADPIETDGTHVTLYDLLEIEIPTSEGGRQLFDGVDDGDGNEFTESDNHRLLIKWHVPENVGSEVLTDSVAFSFEVGAVPSHRHEPDVSDSPLGGTDG